MELSWRRLGALVRGLPAGSALHRALGDGWTPADYLLAEVSDLLAGANWQRANAQTPERKRSPRPAARWRPTLVGRTVEQSPAGLSPAGRVERLRAFHERRAQEVGAADGD